MTLRALVIDEKDNVANLIGRGTKGEVVECSVEGRQEEICVELRDEIPLNHKLALRDISAGEAIIKYGLNIGKASRPIGRGQHVHVHNVESNRCRGDS